MGWHISLSEKPLSVPILILPFSGKLVSPKWKNFKGLKLQWRDKIRLNNAIWRAWYMQCKCCVAGPTTLQVLPPSRGLCTLGPGAGPWNPVCQTEVSLRQSVEIGEPSQIQVSTGGSVL